MLCMPSIEARSNNRMVVRNHFLRGAVEMVLGRQIVTSRKNAAVTRAPHGSHGPASIVGSCCICRDQKRKQRKTRKSCVICGKTVCNEHSVSITMCIQEKMNKLFFLYSFLHVVNTLIDLCCFNKRTSSLKNHD